MSELQGFFYAFAIVGLALFGWFMLNPDATATYLLP